MEYKNNRKFKIDRQDQKVFIFLIYCFNTKDIVSGEHNNIVNIKLKKEVLNNKIVTGLKKFYGARSKLF